MKPHLGLRCIGVSHAFGETQVLSDVNLVTIPGETLAIIGPNGAGKSTLFNLISGAHPIRVGEVRLGQQSLVGLSPFEINRLGLARSFQVSRIFSSLSVAENLRTAALWSRGVRYNFWHRVRDEATLDPHLTTLLETLRLTPKQAQPAGTLSYADQRALELGMTLAGDAPVILLDEPTAGMSRSETALFASRIKQLTADKTVWIIEHDMDVVFALADRIAVLVGGVLIACDTPDNVRRNPQVKMAYLGAWQGEAAP